MGHHRREGSRPLSTTTSSTTDRWEELPDIVAPAPGTTEAEAARAPAPLYSTNDDGFATQFIDKYGNQLMFVPERSAWYTLDPVSETWLKCGVDDVVALAVQLSRELVIQANRETDPRIREARLRDALGKGNSARIKRMEELARCDPRVVVPIEVLDNNPYHLGCLNGVVDLKTATLVPNARLLRVTRRVDTVYNPSATCPRWERYQLEVFNGDKEMIRFIQRAVGYSLTGDTSEHVFFFLYGPGGNGKSTFCEVNQKLLGDYAVRASTRLLTRSDNGREPEQELAKLCGARLLVGSETDQGIKLNESLVKTLCGGDTVTARFLYGHHFSYVPSFKLWMFGNHKPAIRGTDQGMWRRVRLIPFDVRFDGTKCDTALLGKLLAELPGILRWAVDGCRLWLESRLTAPRRVMAATEEYRQDQDILGEFIEEHIERTPEETTPKREVYLRFRAWCDKKGMRPWTENTFTRAMEEHGFEAGRTKRMRFWYGIVLTTER